MSRSLRRNAKIYIVTLNICAKLPNSDINNNKLINNFEAFKPRKNYITSTVLDL